MARTHNAFPRQGTMSCAGRSPPTGCLEPIRSQLQPLKCCPAMKSGPPSSSLLNWMHALLEEAERGCAQSPTRPTPQEPQPRRRDARPCEAGRPATRYVRGSGCPVPPCAPGDAPLDAPSSSSSRSDPTGAFADEGGSRRPNKELHRPLQDSPLAQGGPKMCPQFNAVASTEGEGTCVRGPAARSPTPAAGMCKRTSGSTQSAPPPPITHPRPGTRRRELLSGPRLALYASSGRGGRPSTPDGGGDLAGPRLRNPVADLGSL